MVFNQGSVEYYPGYVQVQVHQYPLVRKIASITNSNPMVITTEFPHEYQPTQTIAFRIPNIFGMQQLNPLIGTILAVTSDTLTMNIDSTNFVPFAYPSPLPSAFSYPYVIPNSEGNLQTGAPLPYANQSDFDATVYNNGQML